MSLFEKVVKVALWPYWVRGALLPSISILLIYLLGFISVLLGFGLKVKFLVYIGFACDSLISIAVVLIGSPIAEVIGIQGTAGGGATLPSLVLTLVVSTLFTGFIAWIYGRTRT